MTRASHKVASPRVVCIEDLRPLARRRVPKAVFDYLDGGGEGEVTLRENCRAFEEVTFRPRHAVVISECDPVAEGQAAQVPRGRARVGAQPQIVATRPPHWCKFEPLAAPPHPS
jgi:FMN-dependent dehydrogenase